MIMMRKVRTYSLLLLLLVTMTSLHAQSGAAFYLENGSTMALGNNIIVNNGNANFNGTISPYNLIVNGDSIFVDRENDFTLFFLSLAIDAGYNSFCSWLLDMNDTSRFINATVDLGAFEYVDLLHKRLYAVHQKPGGTLTLCNNIIVNNPAHTLMTNCGELSSDNILSDSLPLFHDPQYDFSLFGASPAVDAGRDQCNNLARDLQDKPRKCAESIDVGAFEFKVEVIQVDSAYVVFQNQEGPLVFCNNIDINNCVYAQNTNLQQVQSNNIVTDNDSLFMDNTDNFMPKPGSEAIDNGNAGCNSLERDLSDNDRIMGATIDIGAYEQYVQDTIAAYLQYVVHQMNTGSLQLCNNIIVNNPSHDDVVNIDMVPSNNILSDSIPIFCDANLNFKPYEGSPAVDSGMNGCNVLAVDLDMLPRIARTAIDIGAFELPDRDDTIAGGGGWGGGGWGGGGWGWGDPTSDYYHTTVFQHGGDSLLLCNNIIINNSVYIANAYTTADSISNILTDSDTLFVENVENYMPRETSLAVNTGDNSCNELEKDLHNHSRIYQEIIDMGAYEQFSDEDDSLQHKMVLHQVGNGTLLLCNNIIVNNPAHTELSNIEEIPDNNILSDSVVVFRDAVYDFSLWQHSPAVNAGQNNCCSLAEDLERKSRIIGDTIDVGAFEFFAYEPYSDTTCIVWQGDTAELLLCNNIVINNCVYSFNANVSASSSHNILEDNDSIFTDNQNNFLPLPESLAVNQGSNGCNSLEVDLAKHTRIMAEIIDVGAYEQFEAEDDSPTIAAVHQVDTLHELRLYNNIVIQNPYHTHNFSGTTVGSHNLLEDTTDVFVDITSDFSLMQNSPAIDAGDNQYVSWPWDIKQDPRISCADVVDQGAFEFTLDNVSVSLTYSEITSDNCQGSYILLQATPGAQHYYWSHTNEDTCSLIVTPLVSTDYTVIASNGGECVDTAMVHVIPAMALPDSLGSPSSVGKVFWLSYLHNHFRPPTLTLLLSAEQACSGTVSNPLTGWSTAFTVAAHSVSTVQVPLEQAYPENVDEIANFGILVTADDSISVYAANYNSNSFDVTNVLPVNALADEYLLQTYTPMMNAEFVVVATEDNTVVEITPSKALEGGHSANHTFSIMLQQGQTYLGKSRFGGTLGDLSGTVIKALYNKPIAVFNGNVCAMVPSTNSYTDHLVEQAVGVNYWGRSFAITSTESQNFDVVRVTALRDNTEIRKNGVLMATIQAHQTWEHQLSGAEGSCYLETSKPAGVYLYIAGAVLGNPQEMSDPSMIWIPPTEQKLNDLTFATFNSPGISNHYVNIVVPAESVNDVTLDGVSIGGQFSQLSGSSEFAFLRKQIANGTHTLHCDGGFIAHCYGLGFHESYGYAAGYKAVPLTEQLLVNGILNTDLPLDTKFCPYEPISFEVNTNYQCDSVIWNFGDGSPMGNGMALVHSFDTAGTYTVMATLYITSDETVFCTNLYAHIRIVDGATITYYDTVCQGITYQANGFDIPSSESGHYTYTRTVTVPDQYCDSTFVLELEVRDNYLVVQDTVCVNSHYEAYGFDLTPTQLGVLIDTNHLGTGVSGCDSLVILQLVVSPNNDNPPAIEGEAMPCQGGTYTYAIDSLSGLQDVVWTLPDSVMTLPQQNPYEITLMLDSYVDSMEICVTAMGGCGELSWCRTVYPQPYTFVQLTDTLCQNESEYDRYGFVLTDVSDTNDLFVHYDVSAGGCDSTTVLRLVFLSMYEVTDTIVICENDYPYLYHDTLLADTGLYQIMLSSELGCDSLVNLVALSNPVHHTHFYDTVCNAKVWYDSTYTMSGDYDTLLTNVYGCDSVVTMHLTVNPASYNVDSVTACESFNWHDTTYTQSGIYTYAYTNEGGCEIVDTLHLAINPLPVRWDTLRIMRAWLPYPFASADTLLPVGIPDSSSFVWIAPDTVGCDTIVMQTVLVYSEMSVDAMGTINTDCASRNCFYNGPTIMINEVMLAPSSYDGSIWGGGSTRQGEWIELYNPHKCDSVDISCYFLGNNAQDGQEHYSGGFVLPQGTIVPPQGFCLVRGANAPAVPSNLLVQNGGNVVEVVVDDRYCIGTGGTRLWFPNVGGWFAFYDENGVPQDAISWNSLTTSCMSCNPCVPAGSDCSYSGILASYDEIESSRKSYITGLNPENYFGQSFRRIPDGGEWQNMPASPTYGLCNAECVEPAESTGNAIAVAVITGGVPPFTYQWDDLFSQTTDTAVSLSAGTYTVIVTDALGNVDTAVAVVTDFVPEVSHADGVFCLSDTMEVLQGFPLGGTYNGANMAGDTLFFEAGVSLYQMTYTVADSNGCTATDTFQVSVVQNVFPMDSIVCSNELPIVWYGDTLTQTGDYTHTMVNSDGCDTVMTLHLTVHQLPVRMDTLRIMRAWLPYNFPEADTVFSTDIPDTSSFVWWIAVEGDCDTMVIQSVLVYPELSVAATGTINTDCMGRNCFYNGPTIMINEVMLAPQEHDGSIVGSRTSSDDRGEWIELYNPHKCDSVDISCYFLGNNANDNGDYGGGFALPEGTVVPPQGFCLVRGFNAPAVPANLLVENGGNVVEVLVDSRYCFGGGMRLWFPNAGGWFAFYDADGVPQDAIIWNDSNFSCRSCPPCLPGNTGCGFQGTLPSYNDIPDDRKNYITSLDPNYYRDLSFRRIPDGGEWQNIPASPTYGLCNAECVEPAESTGNAIAVAMVTGGVPPFTYQWDDLFSQTTDTAVSLSAGTYTVIVTDALGNVDTAVAVVTDFVPEVSHADGVFCLSDTMEVLQGFPLGGTYNGANMAGDTLFFEAGVSLYQMTYTVADSNGCSATDTFQVTVAQNIFAADSIVCSNVLPIIWYGDTLTQTGDYTHTMVNSDGCDSIMTLHLTVKNATFTSETATACESFLWRDSIYTQSGLYIHSYTNEEGCPCADSLHLIIIQLPELTHSPDTIIVAGTSAALWASGADYYLWSPMEGLSNPNSATPLASPLQSTCYQVTGYAAPSEQDNLVVNGGFEAGYTGFTTDYNYVANPSQYSLGSGNFVINEDAHNVWPLQHQYGYGGNGLFMIVDGASSLNATVWSQTVNVQPNTSYDFSAQIVSLCASDISVARLQFVVNGVQLGPIFEASSTLYQWVKFHNFWNSGDTTTATITILNQNTNGQGNDFGLDDIIFAPMIECSVTDSVCVSVIYSVIDSMTICENELPYEWNGVTFEHADTLQTVLQASNGADSIVVMQLIVNQPVSELVETSTCESYTWNDTTYTTSGNYTQTFTAANGCDSVVTLQLTVNYPTDSTLYDTVLENALPYILNESSYTQSGVYLQTLTNAAGCDSLLTLNLTVLYNVSVSVDSIICASELPLTWNGVTFTEAGTDSVVLVTASGWDSTVVMNLQVIEMPVLTHSADTVIMPGASVSLWASGADIMAWTDADGNTLSSGGNLTVSPATTTTYYVTAFNEGTTVAVNGDFESGNTGFTTSYQYSSNLWPEGNYYVGANAHNYHGNFPNWYDHTSGSGLYMIVNGATVPGTNLWTQTVPVTPNTPYAFSAWVCSLTGGSLSSVARLQFSVNNSQLGDIFHAPLNTGSWNRYYEVWNSGSSTSATLTILNQNTYGGGNDFGVDDILFTPLNFCNVTDSVTVIVAELADSAVCADALPLLWNGVEFTAAGTQSATIPAANGMDSVVVMTVTIIPNTYGSFDTTIVENELPFHYNDSTYFGAGTYIQNLTSSLGCDSILTLALTVLPNVTSEIDSTVCESSLPFTWNDSIFTEAGVKTTTIFASTGVDSTITMTLTVIPPVADTVEVTTCDSLTWIDGVTYYESTDTVTYLLTASNGCDSIVTLHLTVSHPVADSVEATACDSYTWNGTTYTQSGDYIQTFTAANGCDSVVTLHLTVNSSVTEFVEATIVQNDLPYHYVNGQIDTTFAVGTPQLSVTHFSLLTANGCDSTVTLNLTIYQNVTNQVDTTVCAADLPYTWHGHNFTAAGSHVVTLLTSHGADSTVTYHLSVDNITANIGNITHITCYGESTGAATATVTGGQTPMTYAWTNASGTSVATTTSISNRPAGAYTFTVTDHLGCTATATVTLNTLNGQLTPGTIADNQVVCDGEMIPAFTGTTASGGNNGAYQWQISTNGTDWTPAPGTNNAQTYTYPNPAANAFTLRRAWVSQSCGTVYSNIVTVEVAPNSSDTITAEVCQGEPYQENGFDITADQTTEAGNYMYEQHYATGHCDSAVILLLTVWPTASELVEATVCEGDGYSGNGFEISPLETIGVGELQRELTLQTVHGCDSVVRLTLTVIDTAIRIVPLTADFCDNMSMELMVETGMPDYEWNTGETGPTITVTAAGYYSVTATEDGCTATAGYRVEGCQFELVLPNAITPSDFDGVNDYFALPEFFLRDISLFEIVIFNRWGEMVYYSTDKAFRWNGEYRGEIQYQTIYNYVIKYTDTAGRPHRRVGSITVL